jgi:two-component system cell cycle sensor histidine kinase/response regulator CckA
MEGCFEAGTIAMLEDIGDDLGVALDRLRSAERVREMDLRLQEANNLMQLILGHTHIMTVYLDNRFNFIWVNQAYANACRQDPSFFPGKNHFDLYPHAENEAIFRQVVVTGEPYFVTGKAFTFPDQPERGVTYWDWSLVPVKNAADSVTGLVFTLSEVTERMRTEEERRALAEQNRQLQKSESLGRMASAIAHHFNNKLHAVIMSLDLARTAATDDGMELTAALDRAERAALQTAEVSKMMLTYLGQSLSRMAPVDLMQTARSCLPILQAGISGRVVLDAQLDEPGLVVESNPDLIRQVLVNLVTNAGEAMSGGAGTICVRIGRMPAESIPTEHRYPVDWKHAPRGYGYLEVQDDGCGIAEDDFEKLFDPFFSTRFVGRGMGLPVVLGIVKAHAGCVTMESHLRKGTTFRIFLPLTGGHLSSTAALTPGQALPLQLPGSVLVVDDEAAVRLACVVGLRRLGWNVLEAEDGPGALALFQRHQGELACVVCDLTMPGLSGWDVLESMRRLRPGIPFILTSGYGEAQAMAGKRSEKPDHFLGKPFSTGLLARCIAGVTAGRS